MKKIFLILIAASAFVSTSANATKAGFGIDQGFGVTAQFEKINAFIGNDGVSGDYIFKRGSFDGDVPFNWYVGGGAFIGWDNGIGARLPLGINMNFSPKWDAYFQVHPELDFDHGSDGDIKFGIDAAIGVRYSF